MEWLSIGQCDFTYLHIHLFQRSLKEESSPRNVGHPLATTSVA